MPKSLRLLLAALPLAVLIACGTASRNGNGTTTALRVPVPDRVDDTNGPDLLRAFHTLPPNDPSRLALRDALLTWRAQSTAAIVETGDADALAAHLIALSDLVHPSELERGEVPELFEAAARALVARAERLGQEGKVIGALRLLRARHANDGALEQEYGLVTSWGRDARSQLPTAFERYTQLIDEWDEASRIAPAPEVLQALAQLHVERRDTVLEGFQQGPEAMLQVGPLSAQVLRLAPLDVAAVYLRHGLVEEALAHLQRMGDRGETVGQLIAALEAMRNVNTRGADATIELSEVYREARPAAARGMCRFGQSRFPEDPRFPVCLARLAVQDGDAAMALAYYGDALDVDPSSRDLYDEALAAIDDLLEGDLFASDASVARSLADRALHILDERARRFPQAEPPVARARIELLVGTAEMHSGHPQQAVERFESSLRAAESPEALLQLALLRLRTGEAEEAARLYRRALDLTPNTTPIEALRRATILQSLGDAFAASGNADQAGRMWRQSLATWDELAPAMQEPAMIAELQMRRGVLLDQMARHDEAVTAFRSALAAAPQARELYATLLSHLVASPTPDLVFAQEVFREAQRQTTLEPQWRVYFALWVKVVAARAGQPVGSDVVDVLRAQSSTTGWSGKLAAFGTGAIRYDELAGAAEGTGERTEALFYEAARRLAEGDSAGANDLFREVVGNGMVGFYEHAMAQQLLRR
ncbi:MAG: tetratricopeptide repeat protein [Sandaracinus sp.]|nr:tetratricopeptide repeat protein [Sandaracinus sp.]MCB9616168.1 tetratricopeptide repeat protein [Sandaracinus sp.]MCB9618053.1 tetratricopeptide repeat protein [Sandaracinus sp.]